MLTFDVQWLDREITVTVAGEEIVLVVGPEELTDLMGAYNWGVKHGFLNLPEGDEIPVESPLGPAAVENYQILRRVKVWRGLIDPKGEPLPCTEINKLAFFGRYPGALFDLARQLREQETAAAKNSGTSPAG